MQIITTASGTLKTNFPLVIIYEVGNMPEEANVKEKYKRTPNLNVQ
jgi:hypothetical protein